MRLLNLVLIVGVCFAYHNIATIRAEKEAKIAAENSGSGSWKDGTYEGSGQGFGGQIVVSVTIKNGSIDDIQIKEAKNEKIKTKQKEIVEPPLTIAIPFSDDENLMYKLFDIVINNQGKRELKLLIKSKLADLELETGIKVTSNVENLIQQLEGVYILE